MKNLLLLLLLPLFSFSQTTEKSLCNSNWHFRKVGNKNWLPATVPGTVHTDLLKNNLIPDPYFGDNEKKVQWIENEDWEYITSFTVSKKEITQQHIELQFDGLDTYASVYLNDSLILSADNMFRSWNIDVRKHIHTGENKLKIIFESCVKKGREEAKKLMYTLPGDEKVFTRKAQYQYGWDWGPRLVTCGIYKDLKLIFWNNAKLENVQYVLKKLNEDIALLEFHCVVNCSVPGNYSCTVQQNWIEDSDDYVEHINTSKNTDLHKGLNTIYLEYQIKKPKLWWTNGLGEHPLYPFTISLSSSDEMDTKKMNIGLRTLELVQEKDSTGKSFYFKLNGVPVFMKGANYIPSDNFLPRYIKADYEKTLQNAVDANMNMLRVWGGGVYADDAFYEACDKKGILVWQDFMFACAMYPGYEHFVSNVSEEIQQQVTRLRNHPSLALWCGNNEMNEGWKNWGWQKQYNYSKQDSAKIWTDYTNLFQKNIPDILSHSDTEHAYWQSSPSIGWGHKESLLQGDLHYWGVWWGMEPFDIYKQKVGKFVSEYGFQGMPDITTFYKIGIYNKKIHSIRRGGDDTNPDDFNPYNYPVYSDTNKFRFDSVIFNAHQKHPTGYQTISIYMQRDYIIPKDFENYDYVSQVLQAEGMKTAIEAHRRAKPYCMGTLYWQLNDCWPVTSWSTIDYFGNWKASHYQVKRSYEDVLISITEESDSVKIYIINDELKKGTGTLEMKVTDFNGTVLWNKNITVTIKENSSASYFAINKNDLSKFNFRQIVFNAKIKISNTKTAEANYYFVKPKDLLLQKPDIRIVNLPDEDALQIFCNTLAKDVFLSSNREEIQLLENYFDLLPNETKTIYYKRKNTIQPALPYSNITLSELTMKVKSLYDTYNKSNK